MICRITKRSWISIIKFFEDVRAGRIVSAYALDGNGLAAAVSKMAFGNHKGVKIDAQVAKEDLFAADFGSIVTEVPADKVAELTIAGVVVGEVEDDAVLSYGDVKVTMEEALASWKGTLERVFKTVSGAEKNDGPAPESVEAQQAADGGTIDENGCYHAGSIYVCKHKVAKPRVFIPVFPGTNCEYDSTKAFERAGAEVDVKVFKNLTAEDIHDSVELFEKAINEAQIIMFPGGFSAGDEPDGSAKFFATAFQNAKIKEAVMKLVNERDGLALGICNGFQALIKLGLVPYGEICGQKEDSPTLTSTPLDAISPRWSTPKLSATSLHGFRKRSLAVYTATRHPTGKDVLLPMMNGSQKLFANGQVATQYVTPAGELSADEEWNVNGSYMNIEGITSPDGRILGKMAHSERRGDGVAVNITESRILRSLSLGWNILGKIFSRRKVPRGRTESAVPPLDSTLALLFRSAGIVVWRNVLTLRVCLVG